MAVLDVIERDACRRMWRRVGASLKAALLERKTRFASIADVRGHGLFVGVEIVKGGGALDARLRPGDRGHQQAQGQAAS